MQIYNNLKKILFKLDPEFVHNCAEKYMEVAANCPISPTLFSKNCVFLDNSLVSEVFGKKFLNPVGLAAGFDKDAKMLPFLPALGFGFIEVGTVTPKAQIGNEKPRLFRHIDELSLQNAMGFNNLGMDSLYEKLEKISPFVLPIGVNIGKNKITPLENAIDDYKILISKFKDLADYIVINISSPNTPGLRDLQNEKFINELFAVALSITDKPVLLKIAPDLDLESAKQLCNVAINSGARGIIATNTTNDYSLIKNVKHFGGLSGKVLKEKSFKLFDELAKEFYKKTTLISVGGIDNADEAYKRIRAGASLVQVYTSFIYQGPKLCYNINKELSKLLEKDGFGSIKDAIGVDR